jgi:ribose 5-phosphate isomerase B
MKRIYIGSDHAGFKTKEALKEMLEDLSIPFDDVGVFTTKPADYPVIAKTVCKQVVKNKSKGILICGTGIGMSIAANKHKGIRAALVTDILGAELSKSHNNANVLCLSSKTFKSKLKPILMTWFKTRFSSAKRHIRRVSEL